MKFKKNDLPVIIIGAGLSGLLTAYRLKKAGLAINILEARSRAGGRIHTVRGVDGTPLEMGATWFGNQHQNFKKLLEELEIPAFRQYMEESVVFEATPDSPSQKFPIPPQDPSFRIAGGTSEIIQKLFDFFSPEEICFNEQVKRVVVEEGQVNIYTENRNFSAAKVICCLPPALLVDSVKFQPELPGKISSEAKNTHTWMQESVKAGVIYKRPFWRTKKVSTIVSNQGPVVEYYDHSDVENKKFALCGFLHPDTCFLNREQREKEVISQLVRLLGNEAGNYIGYEEVVWENEIFTNANTGETFLPHQNNGNSIFQEPLYGGKVYLSNSETSAVYGGYMEGAVYAANQIAKKIIQESDS